MQTQVPPPPPVFHPSVPPPRPKGSPWISCAIGCAVVAGILVVIAVALFVWLLFPSRSTVEMAALVGPDAAAVVHLTEASNDEGIAALLGKLQYIQRRMQLEAIREGSGARGDRLAEWLVKMQNMNRLQPELIPEMILALEPGDETDADPSLAAESGGATEPPPSVLFGVSLNAVPKLITIPIRFALNAASEQGTEADYRGVKVVSADEVQLLMTKGLFVLATAPGGMKGAIDRLADGTEMAPLLASAPAGLAEQWDVYGVGDNRQGRLTRWVEQLADSGEDSVPLRQLPWDDAVGMHWGLDVVDGDRVRSEVWVTCGDAAGAEAWAGDLRAVADRYAEMIPVEGVDVQVAARVEGVEAVVSIDLVGLDRLLETALEAALESPKAEPPAGGQE